MAIMGAAMKAGLAVLIVLAILLPRLAHSQTKTDTDTALTIAIHPKVSTILQLPDEIVHTWIDHHGEIMVARVGNQLAVRPRPGTRAGVEASLEVETRTLHRTFQLRVVARASDANLDVLVLPVERAQDVEESKPEVPPVAPMEKEPAASASANATSPAVKTAEPEPAPAPTPAESATGRDIEPSAEGAAALAPAPRFELSLHAVVTLLGTTALEVAGYEANEARQSHRALSVRVAVRPRGACWALEANVGGEWLVAPTLHDRTDMDGALETSGRWLRADGGLRMRCGARLIPTAYGGVGLQAHHRDIDLRVPTEPEGRDEGDMPFAGVLALGLGLEYRTGDVSLGLELHIRQGLPDDYRSISAVLSAGFFLDWTRENEP
jgi:hypothetical protein